VGDFDGHRRPRRDTSAEAREGSSDRIVK
jgi:hypothetical protein